MKRLLTRLNIDTYIILLASMVLLASILPARGIGATVAGICADAGIFALFFLHGARLSRQAVVDGARHWRLHLTVAAMTFVIFPLCGIAIRAIPHLDPAIGTGMLFLTLLPSTVQSSIAFTAMARGNVAAAVCSASFSNLAGIFITPLLVALLITGKQGGFSVDAVMTIVFQLLLPFLAGHFLRPWIAEWIARRKTMLMVVDRGSILLVVYTAFSAAVVEGLWARISLAYFGTVALLSAILLTIVLLLSREVGRWFGFSREDSIVLQFCGSKKSLASGVPMAGVLFTAPQIGVVILPLMFFHQFQLMICAVLARRYAAAIEREEIATAG
ncbi:bile acid:sodium symporter family protein [Sphingobium boeckii]|uniref:Sodium/bile acid cotransporter 7 n=1 Tax=Sphingobium boeckii TaxID=1082345 RepID=A0A7W9EF50_9SPHN|nr:bile acid:sodium symporter family protein [Sphingobium boeckii]MBB5685700.1 sodium/bile acid cotransporter 7 [Sphingobium boeckii]